MTATLGQLIRQRRMDLGLTQEELAERVGDGMRQAEISRLERDRVGLPRRNRMEQIARALDVPLGVLLARSGWVGAQDAFPSAEGPQEPEEREIATERVAVLQYNGSAVTNDVPHLSDAISRARELALRTEDAIRQAQVSFDSARRSLDRRNGGGT